MKTDRELLEAAAKVSGLNVFSVTGEGGLVGESIMECGLWNPLTDDGDALRLAVALKIILMPYPTEAETRRAIVRAAAKIGEAK